MLRYCAALLGLAMLHACTTPAPRDAPAAKTAAQPDAQDHTQQPDTKPAPPASFTDHVAYYKNEQIPFEMVLIPGSDDGGLTPFYIAKTEVSWDMFIRWSYGEDLQDEKNQYAKWAKLRDKGLRPSLAYSEQPGHGLGRSDLKEWKRRPVVGLSWLTARGYCLWLSEKTGRTYRLPTDQEWRHVLELSGGVPRNRTELFEQAQLIDNAQWRQDPFIDQAVTLPVASKKANALGLHDLLGNAAEWVQPEDGKRWVRGGSIWTHAKDLTADWRAVEDQSIWNETYPDFPVSRFWYVDRYDVGFRLVCEVEKPTQETDPARPPQPTEP